MARKAYKALYLAEQAKRAELELRLLNQQRQLDELNAALIPFGQQTLEAFETASGGALELLPLPYVAARAFLEANQRVTYPSEGYSQLYTWKGCPLMRRSR